MAYNPNALSSPWFRQANASPAPRRAPARRSAPRKPRGTYTKGPVRSSGTRVQASIPSAGQRYMGPANYKAPPKPKAAPVVRAAPAGMPATGGAGMGTGVPSMPSPSMPSDRYLRSEAMKAVASELDPQIRARNFARQEETRGYTAALGKLTKQLGLSKGDTAAVYDALVANLTQQSGKTQQAYAAGKASSGAAYDQLVSMLGADYGKATADTQAELTRLGVGNPNATAQLTREQALQTGAARGGKAVAQSTLDALAAANAGEMGAVTGAARSTGPMVANRLQQAYDENTANLGQAHTSVLNRLAFELAQLSGSRSGRIDQTYNALKEAAYQKAQDAAQQQFLNQIRGAQLGISAGQLGVAQENAATSRASAVSAAQARLRAKQPAPTGIERAYGFMRSGYRGRASQGDLQQALVDVLNGNSNDPGWRPGTGVPGYDPKYLDQYMRDIDRAVRDRLGKGWGAAERDLLRNAALKYFGR